MDILALFAMVVLVSSSGALSPGPLTVATIRYSIERGGSSGLIISLGHMTFELPLVVAISAGVASFIDSPTVKLSIGLAGSAALIVFGLLQSIPLLRAGRRSGPSDPDQQASTDKWYSVVAKIGWFQAFLLGFTFTALNPYFIMWWMTIGLTLITSFLAYASLAGVLLMYLFHVWIDYAWLGLLSVLTSKSRGFLKSVYLRYVSLALSTLLVLLGVYQMFSLTSDFMVSRSP